MKVGIFLNNGETPKDIYPVDKYICCDKALDNCPIRPNYFVGDGDSVSHLPTDIKTIKHSSIKDFTDGESAVHVAHDLGANSIDFYGVTGGRYDHTLGNLAIMHLALDLGITCTAFNSDCDIVGLSASVTPKFSMKINKGTTFSLVPHGGRAVVTNGTGTFYPIDNLTLTSKDTHGISNVTTLDTISLEVIEGTVFLFINK